MAFQVPYMNAKKWSYEIIYYLKENNFMLAI